ncbi:MAG TPA: hypothetical protein DCS07_02195 [Bdellovibrionales bacterium]|nr:MAG: hypothetical protein A2Z97_04030 [Bdellovibrionales bacterium GWB1_52_6]OFZ04675.1 MAG: hypothetical protein A2X97_14010 [Bdellovibrionales bacterium GWA1_52_35]OFZ40939.1 MAG: hypothetical protein A2070_06775 [Bdellovibrionales bacterium GWC1_52_8]HAR41436.1 hypothetical protein [Bdellovibrionales bacterium]HCM39908.1 hypothetical protein [Bdellovibrionales bacterium]
MFQKSLIAVVVLSALTGLTPARADFYLHPWTNQNQEKQRLELTATGNYYTSTQNFDAYGALLIPNQLQRYSRFGTDLTAALGLTDRLTGFGTFSWARTQVDTIINSGSSFGLTDQTLGVNFRILGNPNGRPHSRVSLDLQLRFDFPGYNNATSDLNSSPWLGDGSQDLTSGGFVKIPLFQKNERTLLLEAGLGYTYRSAGFSAAVPWSAFLQLIRPDKGWQVSLGLTGIYSLENDSTNLATLTSTARSSGTAGSFMTNAVNPSLTTVSGQLGYRVKPSFDVIAGLNQAITGQNAPTGLQVFGGFQARLGGAPAVLSTLQLSPAEYGKANQGFVHYQGVEAKVLRTNDRLNMIKIDKGSNEGIEIGHTFDIFTVKPNREVGEAVARGRISSIKADEAVLTVTEYFKEVWIDEGFVARRPIE